MSKDNLDIASVLNFTPQLDSATQMSEAFQKVRQTVSRGSYITYDTVDAPLEELNSSNAFVDYSTMPLIPIEQKEPEIIEESQINSFTEIAIEEYAQPTDD